MSDDDVFVIRRDDGSIAMATSDEVVAKARACGTWTYERYVQGSRLGTLTAENERLGNELFERSSRLHSLEEKYAEACRQLDSVTGNLQELTEATTMRGDGGHSRRCVQCDHWAVVEKCGICGAEEATDGAGISVEARLAKDLYSQGCRLGESIEVRQRDDLDGKSVQLSYNDHHAIGATMYDALRGLAFHLYKMEPLPRGPRLDGCDVCGGAHTNEEHDANSDSEGRYSPPAAPTPDSPVICHDYRIQTASWCIRERNHQGPHKDAFGSEWPWTVSAVERQTPK